MNKTILTVNEICTRWDDRGSTWYIPVCEALNITWPLPDAGKPFWQREIDFERELLNNFGKTNLFVISPCHIKYNYNLNRDFTFSLKKPTKPLEIL